MKTADMHNRPVNADGYTIRDAAEADIPALAQLHVQTWNDTYGRVGPSVALRESQWREAFATNDGSWFCLLLTDPDGELIGFAKGQRYESEDLPQFDGELNKIFLLRQYHGRGLGKLLVGHVARRLLGMGIRSMVLFGEADNPTCGFHEALGGTRLDPGLGNYGWSDLEALALRCGA